MLAGSIEWILVVSGIATAAAGFTALLLPRQLLRLAFGVEAPDGSTMFFVRHWGALIFVMGTLIAYSAYSPATRSPVMLAGALEKLAIVALIFFGPLKRTMAMTAIAIADGLFAVLYVAYLSGI